MLELVLSLLKCGINSLLILIEKEGLYGYIKHVAVAAYASLTSVKMR
jgi:hypothetical protein